MLTRIQGNRQLCNPYVQKSQFKKEQPPSFKGTINFKLVEGVENAGNSILLFDKFQGMVFKLMFQSSLVRENGSFNGSVRDKVFTFDFKDYFDPILEGITQAFRKIVKTENLEDVVEVSCTPTVEKTQEKLDTGLSQVLTDTLNVLHRVQKQVQEGKRRSIRRLVNSSTSV